MTSPRLIDTLTVTRKPDGSTTVSVDGEDLPWMLGNEPVSVDVAVGQPGGVRLTLLARHVRVNDDVLAGFDAAVLEHTHDDDAPAPAPAEPPAAPPPPADHGTVTDRSGTTWPRCSATCSLKALGNGTAVCDRDDCTPPAGKKPQP